METTAKKIICLTMADIVAYKGAVRIRKGSSRVSWIMGNFGIRKNEPPKSRDKKKL